MPTRASKQPAAPARERHDSTVNVRMSTTTRNLIDTAASLLGKTRSEFITESARQHAVDILLDQRLFVLNEKDFAEFEAALDRPPPPNEDLRALLKKKPLWEK
ncbi:DUF1778 domain-containing protein [Methylosinus sp. PW1]|uniref:type II toxin-antitoxin system TacA family antitoxin n=1 Tax=Methylosinus sp. PW1 TaxID=107636 RepID=UPI0006896D3A|nr:DUF1778 domain-containing protein [Methylosinus sp. PW1]